MKPIFAGILGGLLSAVAATVIVFLVGMWTEALDFHSSAPMALRITVMLVGYFGIPITGVVAGFAFARRARKRGIHAGA